MKRHHLACPVQEFRSGGKTGRFWRFGWTLDTAVPLCYATNTCPARISVSRRHAANRLRCGWKQCNRRRRSHLQTRTGIASRMSLDVALWRLMEIENIIRYSPLPWG